MARIETRTRACRHCGDFDRYILANGHAHQCVTCTRRRNLARQGTAAGRLRGSFNSARQRAKERGLAFTIELDKLTIPDRCPVLGIPIDVPSIDRDDPTKGYTPDNVTVMSWRANNIKGDATLGELLQLVAYLRGKNA